MLDDEDDLLAQLFENGRINALLAWPIVVLYFIVLIESISDWDLPWIVFTLTCTVVILIPPAIQRSYVAMLPWELLLVASFPVIVRALDVSTLANTFSTYLSIAALALILTVELHVLSRVKVTHWFAVVFVVLTTLAAAGGWAIIRWNMDRFLDTDLLSTNEALMVEFLWVLAAGLVAGVVFDLYFRRRAGRLRQTFSWVIRR